MDGYRVWGVHDVADHIIKAGYFWGGVRGPGGLVDQP